MRAWLLVLMPDFNQTPRSSHMANFVEHEVVVVAQKMRSGLSEDCNEVYVVRISHYGLVMLHNHTPRVVQTP